VKSPRTAPHPQYPHNSSYPESAGRRSGRARLLAAAALLASTVPAAPTPSTPAAAHHHVSRPRPPAPAAGVHPVATALAGAAPAEPKAATCVSSWYGEAHRGRPTASGVPFDPDALTAASWNHDFGTRLAVTHGTHTVVVTVNDRGPARALNRCVDLSAAAFARLADLDAGLIDVTVEEVAP
jgi:rare lipoprotein A